MIFFAFFAGLYINSGENSLQLAYSNTKTKFLRALTFLKNEMLVEWGIYPAYFLQPALHEGEGVTINKTQDDNFVLLSGYFHPNLEIRLIRRNGEIIARWPAVYSELFAKNEIPSWLYPSTDWHVDLHGAAMLPDGSVVFNFEYFGMVKLDRCGKVVWKVAKPTHHSVEIAEEGGFWVPGRIVQESGASEYPPFNPPYIVDTIMKISSDGEIVSEHSIPKILYDNDLGALLSSTGQTIRRTSSWDNEIVHVNKIAELPSELAKDFPLFSAGDLAISIRGLNLVLVIDPQHHQVKWWRVGPWLRQHDPEFKFGGKIVLFNNNIFATDFDPMIDRVWSASPRVSNIIEIDPVTDQYKIIYGAEPDHKLLSIIRGKIDLIQQGKGGVLITEFEGGRVLEVDSQGEIVWQYINRYDAEEVAEISEARVYPQNYFSVTDWNCPK